MSTSYSIPRIFSWFHVIGLTWGGTVLAPQLRAAGPEPVDLGSAAHFTILAGAAITTTGGGIINGDIGASPIAGTAIHLTAAQVNGTIYTVDANGPAGSVTAPALLGVAKGDLMTAMVASAGRTPIPSGPFRNPGAGNLGGLTLIPGLYKIDATASITGADLTLNGGPDDVWIFQIGEDLIVGSSVHVILAGGAQPRNIFWQVTTAATIETFAVFKGTIMANQAIVMNTSSTLDGRALAFTAGVTYNGTGGTLPLPKVPVFTDITRTDDGDVTVVLRTTPFYKLTLQTSVNLTLPIWTTVTNDTPEAVTWSWTHPAPLATGPRRYYRAFLAPY